MIVGVALVVGASALSGCGTSSDTPALITVSSTPVSRPVGPGFVGVSIEYPALQAYTGSDPATINPVFVHMLSVLAPGQAPVVRIGGNSSDETWWPLAGVTPPAKVAFALTPSWVQSAGALARALGGKLILGVNMAADEPQIAAAEASAFERGIGSRYIDALEVGNEGDLYGRKPGYQAGQPSPILPRPQSYDLATFTSEFTSFRQALGAAPVAGPAFAWLQWMGGLGRFLAAEPGLSLVTFHRYPLHGCNQPPGTPGAASIPHLLSDYAISQLAAPIAGYAAVAHAHGLAFRVDELNSVACAGKLGVSNTFASALWALSELLDLARAGADGVNLHTFPGAGYQLFSFRFVGGAWQASVKPEYYGLRLFADVAPAGSRLLQSSPATQPVGVWATRAPDGTIRVVLVNDDLRTPHTATIAVPQAAGEVARLERLLAPTARSTQGITLGGQSIDAAGRLSGRFQRVFAVATDSRYSITLPAASAAVLTLIPRLTSTPASP